jgi:hypothetical protein
MYAIVVTSPEGKLAIASYQYDLRSYCNNWKLMWVGEISKHGERHTKKFMQCRNLLERGKGV